MSRMGGLFSVIAAFLHYRIKVRIYEAHIEKYVITCQQRLIIQRLKRKNIINVVFLAMNTAMWKYQHLYDMLSKDSRFSLHVFLAPSTTFSLEARCNDLKGMRTYFNEHKVPYVDFELEKGLEPIDIKSVVDPDIIFYTQPYENVVDDIYMFSHFKNKLLALVPYALHVRNNYFYDNNMRFNNLAWRIYHPMAENKDLAVKYAFNRGRNVVVVGNPNVDDYVLPQKTDPWKIKDKAMKRIIWAPHFTIVNGLGFAQISYFLEIADFMQQLAINYSNKITIAFKPHPRLYSELERHPEWGEKRTKEYYTFWENYPTTQLETGDYIDLFKSSDAMIHDSASFIVDYLYFHKPVLYDNPDIESAKITANEMGKKAYEVHYTISSKEDIKLFIDKVVIDGNDPMRAQRDDYYKCYLLPPNGDSVAQNIYNDMINSLGLKDRHE